MHYKVALQHIIQVLSTLYDNVECEIIAWLLLENITQKNKLRFVLDNYFLLEDEQKLMEISIKALAKGTPIQHLIGTIPFYNVVIKCSKSALIPRPETAELVDLIINNSNANNIKRAIDIGTGTGCIAIALKKNLPKIDITAIDAHIEALLLAEENADINNTKIRFLQENIFEPSVLLGDYDLIVSNPPYIEMSEIVDMHINVTAHEPASALFVPNGKALIYYEAIIDFAHRGLNTNGLIYFECNEKFANDVKELLIINQFKNVDVIKDMQGKDRIVTGQK